MRVGDLVRLKSDLDRATWSDGLGLVIAIEKQFGWKDHQAFIYWHNENKIWTFTVSALEVISEGR